MSLEFDITASDKWHIGERKDIDIRVLDDVGNPVNLAAIELVWHVARDNRGLNVYLTRSTEDSTIERRAHEDDTGGVLSVARCKVAATDYELFPRPGEWRHELRDNDDNLVLSYGKVRLLPAMQVVSELS